MPLLEYLFNMVAMVTLGVVLASVMVEMNILASLSAPLRWLCRASNLPECCMVSVLASTINATAGRSALAGFYRNGEAKETEIILSILISTFPIALGEYVFLVQAPISIALLGLKVGTAYVLLSLFSSFLQSFSALVYSRLTRPSQTCSIGRQDATKLKINGGTVRKGISNSVPTLMKVLPFLVGTMVFMDLLMRAGMLENMKLVFDPVLRVLGLPGECIAPLVMQFVHYSAGYAAIASLYSSQTITEKQALITLLVGSMAVITMIYIRYSTPTYLSLFGRFGAKIAAISYLSSIGAKGITILLAYLLI
ncbi:MAG: hypothetical protein M0Q43_02340 [Methanothrix sp.]|jgi:hypothetical protein|uniref:nucleoside recognition domain-containing protein n=1 Tax=Methanothrix sp. TaxID=90426 RepID=UPI0025EB5FF3|nr:nucleoside recognition domain-containing protein [Methanothrix sp.]MCK9407224.1 hypothetical protein [Methanothrix sp.]MCK9564873.1 hypothetical protein [Methanothrix sp.]